MIFPDQFERQLGFDHIRERMAGYCLSEAGIRRIRKINFITDGGLILLRLNQCFELKKIITNSEPLPTENYFDVQHLLNRLKIPGSFLEPHEYFHLRQGLKSILAIRKFLDQRNDSYPTLFKMLEGWQMPVNVLSSIDRVIDEHGLVRNGASERLGAIRKLLHDNGIKLRNIGTSSFRQAVSSGWVPEGANPTIREGRMVIPILAEFKRKFKGVIHDESATGQTVFMEPAESLEINNEIRDLQHAEKREIILILTKLNDEILPYYNDVEHAFDFQAETDAIRAKALLAIKIDATLPEVLIKPHLQWRNARHPLLVLQAERNVVPLSLQLTPESRMLLISGPNAGGKSVCLKTIGLLQYMLQCGLLVPADENSVFGIFHDLLVDIGDQQSIENDLSTYSSHLRNMAFFINNGNENSLILLDELGTGTDPEFGGAIAQSVLHHLLQKGTWGAATTHFSNLKLFAAQAPGIVNASMRFDEKNLQPLYRLEMGRPGSSFALEIARKTGLPDDVLKNAESLIGKDLGKLEELLRDLEQERTGLVNRSEEVKQLETSLKKTKETFEKLSEELRTKKKEIMNEARQSASDLLDEANREIERTIRHIRENRAERKETGKARKNLRELNQKVKTTESNVVSTPPSFKNGDYVKIQGQDGSGTILTVGKGRAEVQFGSLRTTIPVTRLELTDGPSRGKTAVKTPVLGIDMVSRQARFSNSLDMRGVRAEDARVLLEQFIDEALLMGTSEVRIVHGKGNGILRKVVRDELKKQRSIALVEDEHVDRGGDGVTIVKFK